MEMEKEEKPLERAEATLVSYWLVIQKEKKVKQGWLSVWKQAPSDIARTYGVTVKEVLLAAKRELA